MAITFAAGKDLNDLQRIEEGISQRLKRVRYDSAAGSLRESSGGSGRIRDDRKSKKCLVT